MASPSEMCSFCKEPAKDGQKLKVCGGCHIAKYCSAHCQRAHWKEHKKICKKKKKQKAKPQKKQDDGGKKVLWADQQRINKFGRLNNRLQEIKELIIKKKSETDNLKEAVEDIDNLLDDDACKIKIGEVYIEVSNEEAEEYAKECDIKATEDLEILKNEVTKIEKEMKVLKVELYAKFGNTINLETTPSGDGRKHLQK